jgi:hypothetical protein
MTAPSSDGLNVGKKAEPIPSDSFIAAAQVEGQTEKAPPLGEAEVTDQRTIGNADAAADGSNNEKPQKDQHEVDFESEDDPFHPLNHSKVKKWAAVLTVSSAAVCV